MGHRHEGGPDYGRLENQPETFWLYPSIPKEPWHVMSRKGRWKQCPIVNTNPLPYVCVHAQSFSCDWLFVTPWTVAHQASLFMEFSLPLHTWEAQSPPLPPHKQLNNIIRLLVIFTSNYFVFHRKKKKMRERDWQVTICFPLIHFEFLSNTLYWLYKHKLHSRDSQYVSSRL